MTKPPAPLAPASLPGPSPDAGKPFREYVEAIWKRRLWIASTAVAGLLGGLVLAWRAPDVYAVTTRVDIAKQRPFGVGSTVGGVMISTGEAYVESQLYYPTRWALLGSTTYVDSLLRETDGPEGKAFPMWDWLTWPATADAPPARDVEKDLGPPLLEATAVEAPASPARVKAAGEAALERLSGVPVAAFRERFAFREYGPRPQRRADARFKDPSELRGVLLDRVRVNPEKGTTLVEIALEGENRVVLAPLVNLLIETFAREQRSEMQKRLEREHGYWESRRREIDEPDRVTEKPGRWKREAAALEDWKREHATDANQLSLWKEMLSKAVLEDETRIREDTERIAHARADVEAIAGANALLRGSDGATGAAASADPDAADRALLAALKAAAEEAERAVLPTTEETRFHRLPFVLADARIADLSAQILARSVSSPVQVPALRAERNAAVRDLVRKRVASAAADLELRLAHRQQRRLDEAALRERWEASSELADLQAKVDRVTAERKEIGDQLQAIKSKMEVEKDVKPLKVIEVASDPSQPVRPNRPLWVVIGAGLGVLLGMSLALFLDWLDDTVAEPKDVERHLGVPVVGTIVTVGSTEGGSPDRIAATAPRSPVAEAFRALRTSVEFVGEEGQGGRVLLVSSCSPREGKTMVALNLASVLAQDHKRTLIVDADLRKPRLHRVFGVEGRVGLSNVLAGKATVEEAVVPTGEENLWVLPCGAIPPNPAELLGRSSAAEVFLALKGRFDRIVVDSPPLGVVTDPAVLARHASLVLLVVSAGRTKKRAAEHGVSVLRSVGVEPAGAVLNLVRKGSRWLYGGYYDRKGSGYYASSEGDAPSA